MTSIFFLQENHKVGTKKNAKRELNYQVRFGQLAFG